MNTIQMNQIFNDTAYTRVSGSAEELKCAKYLQDKCTEMGLEAYLEEFEVNMVDMERAELIIEGRMIPCKGYFSCGSGEVTAPLYYLRHDNRFSLENCRGKIVLMDGNMGYWKYQDLLKYGAVGFITYDGNANYMDSDIGQRELRFEIGEEQKIPGVNINVKDAIAIVKSGAKMATMIIEQQSRIGKSRNVLLDLPGEKEEWIVVSAHYDSTPLSFGSYDNMSSCIGQLYMAEYFAQRPHRYGLRFLWCGSEERGLLGSKAYCEQHKEELDAIVLNINLDMLGCIMGNFVAFSTAEEKLAHYMEYMAAELGFDLEARYGIRSSDSNSFADQGIPSATFARYAPGNAATIHNRYDTPEVVSAEQLTEDMDFIIAFTERMANAKQCPVAREIPDKIKEDIDRYMNRKR